MNRQSYFAKDVAKGLQSKPKYLLSKYFYDERGDALFQEIMKLPEYYLSPSEREILEQYKEALLQLLQPEGYFHLLDLGAGDGSKTKILLKYFLGKGLDFRYCPVDISPHAVEALSTRLRKEFPQLQLRGLSMEYLRALEEVPKTSQKLLLFLGSSIGNFTQAESLEFLQQLSHRMQEGDLLLIGFDLKKEPERILKAYNDPSGITRDFNLNLLHRINRELGANFRLEAYEHSPYYDAASGEARSQLVSLEDQRVEIPSLSLQVEFQIGEAIHTEISKKYDLQEIAALAKASGFELLRNFSDSRKFFVDSVWRKVR